jgi:Mg-chelatase subunit ChlD
MRLSAITLALFLTGWGPALAKVEIVSPLEGGQVLGQTVIEARAGGTPDRVDFFVDGVLIAIDRQAPYQVIFDFGDSLAPRRVEVVAHSAGFRNVERHSITTAGTTISDTIEVNLVEVPLRIRSRRAVTAADLRITENGKAQKIAEVRAERLPTSFIFVVDRSLSMGEGRLTAAVDAVERALGHLRPGDDARIILFNHRSEAPRQLQPAANAWLREVEPAGGTSLRDTLMTIRPERRAAIVVISDGGDRNSASGEEEALRAIGRGNTVLYALALGGGSGASFLDRAASRTGGTFRISSAGTLAADASAIITDINSRHTVVYQSNNIAAGWREIRVTPARPRIEVSAAKRGYYSR